MKFVAAALVLSVVLAGCALSTETAASRAQAAPFSERPKIYEQFLREGKITESQRQQLMGLWQQQKADQEAEAKMLATMTPSERATYLFQKEQLELQRQQLAAQRDLVRAQKSANLQRALQENSRYLQNNAAMIGQQAAAGYGTQRAYQPRPVNGGAGF